jgi:hypothetical protein
VGKKCRVFRHGWLQGVILPRRMAHTAHHRGRLMAMLRMMGHDVHSNYGPTADTGGLMQHQAPTIYAYPSLQALLDGEAAGGAKAVLPGAHGQPVTERPDPAAAFQTFHNETPISH